MQRSLRMNEVQLLALAEKALNDNGMRGYLFKRSSDSAKWQLRWFVLFQNLLFYYENESCTSRPSGVIFLEGSYVDKIVSSSRSSSSIPQHSFLLTYRKEGSKHYEIRAESESEINAWIRCIESASFSKLLAQKEELEQKHLHLVQIVESEKTAKWQYTQQCEELTMEIKKLRQELCELKKEWRLTPQRSISFEEPDEIRKIKKVQSFFRGWLCRRRWKQIVSEYISSPHAENMRKRNSLVFRMVEAEEEYMEQLQLLISCFLRPFKMCASSQRPVVSHDEVNSIFLNAETLSFLHNIFLKGLTSRMESWPTLVLGDLFDMLLPMLVIYQEYVRNHHFSLQVLAECKQKEAFVKMLKRLEEKPVLQGRTLETFLTYPMHQIPRYIITLHELLAHTPHNHVERRSLENAKSKLEELSRQMHDEVSETENIRKNLAIERIIIGGCDILLDVNQVFVRQGNMLQVLTSKELRAIRGFRGSFRGGDKELARQCFLFSNHLLLCVRASNGKLQLLDGIGRIPLSEATLIEEPSEQFQFVIEDGDGQQSQGAQLVGSDLTSLPSNPPTPVHRPSSASVASGTGSLCSANLVDKDYAGLDFKIIWDCKTGPAKTIHLVAPSMQEKTAWVSDISQCIDNVHFNDLFHGAMNDSSSVTMPHSIRNDPRLYKDDVDIRFSKTLNSCKLPQIRYASPERLFERLTDLRFLSIDFLNTFLLTYRVFTDGVTVLEALKKVHYSPENQLKNWSPGDADAPSQVEASSNEFEFERRISSSSMGDLPQHRESVVSTSSDSQVQMIQHQQQKMIMNKNSQHWRLSHRKFEEEQARERYIKRWGINTNDQSGSSESSPTEMSEQQNKSTTQIEGGSVPPPPSPEVPVRTVMMDSLRIDTSAAQLDVPHSTSSETLKADQSYPSSPNLSSAASSCTLVEAVDDGNSIQATTAATAVTSAATSVSPKDNFQSSSIQEVPQRKSLNPFVEDEEVSQKADPNVNASRSSSRTTASRLSNASIITTKESGMSYLKVGRSSSGKRGSADSAEISVTASNSPRSSFQTDITVLSTPRSSFQFTDTQQMSSKAGVVVTSSRASARRSSTASAASAFAVATAASSNPPDMAIFGTCQSVPQSRGGSRLPSAVGSDLKIVPDAVKLATCRKRESMISTAATMRVLNVLRHWISKHSQDFENDPKLMQMTREFLEELVHNTNLLPAEHRAASQLLAMITKEDFNRKIDLDALLVPPSKPSKETIESLSALEIAEGMTYLDHKIFVSIQSEEFLDQAWMKDEKDTKAHHITLMTQRFNDMSRLVASEILRQSELSKRVAIIEKWAAVADICRCLHNFNGVLQICAAFSNSSIHRLKKTWDKLCKTTRQSIDKLQNLVNTDGKFRSMREALHRCDPPCIPFLGMYLTDLSYIEEGTPNFTEDGHLLNFSKMRMIAHVIREIKHFQQTPYKIEPSPKVLSYLLDTNRLLSDDELYQRSLCLEPRLSRLGSRVTSTSPFPSTSPNTSSPAHTTSATAAATSESPSNAHLSA